MPEREQEFGRITRDYQAAKDLYDSLLKRYDEAQLGESMETDRQGERFRILEAGAAAVHRPSRRIGIGCSLSGLAAGRRWRPSAPRSIAEQFDPTFHSVDDCASSRKCRCSPAIPFIASGHSRRRVAKRRWRRRPFSW